VKPFPLLLLLGSVLAISAAGGACSGSALSENGEPPDALLPPAEDAVLLADGAGGGGGLSTLVRVANLAPWLGAVDICVLAPGFQTFEGPLISPPADAGSAPDAAIDFDVFASEDDAYVFDATPDGTNPDSDLGDVAFPDGAKADGSAPDAGEPETSSEGGETGLGLAPFALSRYIELKAVGTFEFAIVEAGAQSCGSPRFTQQVTLDSGQKTTVVLGLGLAGSPSDSGTALDEAGHEEAGAKDGGLRFPLRLLSFTDEADPAPGASRTRFIDVPSPMSPASTRAAISIGVLDPTSRLSTLASVVAPGSAASPSSTPPVVDALGYNDGNPVHGPLAFWIQPIDDAGAGPWTSMVLELDLLAGSVHTGFVFAGARDGFQVLWCDDGAKASKLADCTLIGQ